MKKSKKILLAILGVFLSIVIAAGCYVCNMTGIFNQGNAKKYAPENAKIIDSGLKGKTIIFLGSSVTVGLGARGDSFVNYLEAQDSVTAVEEAKSGTTLANDNDDSYVARMKTIDKSIKADAFVCQLSTNDATMNKDLGEVSPKGTAMEDLDTTKVAGAMEYIVQYASETWDCPVIFYTCARYDSENYQEMVDLLYEVQDKYDIGIIDLWNNEEVNSISKKMLRRYRTDDIHPTRQGYLEWYTPVIRSYLVDILCTQNMRYLINGNQVTEHHFWQSLHGIASEHLKMRLIDGWKVCLGGSEYRIAGVK